MIAFDRQGMDNRKIQGLIEDLGTIIEGHLGYWQFEYEGRKLYTVSDENHNRMRIMASIVESEGLSEDTLFKMLNANFDRALDAKYAISNGVAWGLFTHPLKELTAPQFVDAVEQVWKLAENFGTSYSSSNLFFGGDMFS